MMYLINLTPLTAAWLVGFTLKGEAVGRGTDLENLLYHDASKNHTVTY